MADSSLEAELPEALDGQRIDRVVAMLAEVSRSTAAGLISSGRVLLDGVPAERPSLKVAAGAHLVVHLEAPVNDLVGDESIELHVVHDDDQVVVVDKQAGLVVHPGSGVRHGTMVHALLARYPELIEVGPAERPGIVHRLDKGTSGLVMVARTAEAHRSLTDQLKARTVERRYRTLVWGSVEAERGVIDAPLGRSPRHAIRRAVVASGRPARTYYEVVARHEVLAGAGLAANVFTELTCRLETGRTHQIRAHLLAIGHPVLGDASYGGSAEGTGLTLPGRPFLHAEVLGFDRPVSGERLRFTSPLPVELAAVLSQLRAGRPG